MIAVLTGVVTALLTAHLLSVAVVLRRLATPVSAHPGSAHPGSALLPAAPPITLLRPVCGLDRFDAETLASSFGQDYPQHDILFCVARADDPAVPVLRDLIARHPDVRATLLIGDDKISANPKLNNLQKGWRGATGDWVVMADANLLLPPDYLRQVMAARRKDTVLVTSPPIGTRPEGVWASLECAFLNGNQARLQLLADEAGLGFAQGKTLCWDRAFLQQQGGLAALGSFLAEDVAATRLVRRAGRGLVLTQHPFAQPVGPRALRAVWQRQLRWSKVRRDGFPALFLLEPLNGGLVPVILAGVIWGPWGALALAGTWYMAELYLCWRAGWPLTAISVPAMILRDLMLPGLWCATFGNRGFDWRGNSIAPHPNAHLNARVSE